MKIQGRLIVILAVLGLLAAMVPLATAGAVAGSVKIKGGENAQFFSNQTKYNILTVEVKDADLTPLRMSIARTDLTGDTSAFNLKGFVVTGHKDKTDDFNGGQNNPLCDHDGDDANDDGEKDSDTSQTATAKVRYPANTPDANRYIDADDDNVNDDGEAAPASCMTKGDLWYTDGNVGVYTAADPVTTEAVPVAPVTTGDTPRFSLALSGIARDNDQSNSATGAGALEAADIVKVVVNGVTIPAESATTTSGARYTVRTAGAAETESTDAQLANPQQADVSVNGGGIIHVFLKEASPNASKDSVSVTYRVTEFEFSNVTPLEYDATIVKSERANTVGVDYTLATNRLGLAGVGAGSVNTSLSANGATVISFGFDVKDSFTADKSGVSVNSTYPVDFNLAIEETGAASDTFTARVAVLSDADYTAISNEAAKPKPNTTDGSLLYDTTGDDKIVTVGELVGATGSDAALGTTSDNLSIKARLKAAADKVFDDGDSATSDDGDGKDVKDFLALTIRSRHNNIINVVYRDANPSTSVSKSATVDLQAPVVTVVSPADGFNTNIASVTMSAEVTDADAGVEPGDITLVIDDDFSKGDTVKSPIVNGYRVTAASQGTIKEGKREWFIAVKDKVGNIPPADAPVGCRSDKATPCAVEAPKGAAKDGASAADNPFTFTVDTKAPELTDVGTKTGRSLKNAGAPDESENKTNQNTWVRVAFDIGDGDAALDPATVGANDFRVDGAAPLDAKVNSTAHKDGTTTLAKGTAVYLQVGKLDTDARPKVELTGEVKDKAGNIRTSGSANAADGLSPVLTVTPSADIAKDAVTVTVSSSEGLDTNPVVNLTTTKPVKDTDTVSPKPLAMSLQVGSLTTWTGTFKNTSGQASKQYVTVTASDQNSNQAMKGFAKTETDIISFQLDSAPPELEFVDTNGKDLKTTKQEEGAVWIVAEFDEDEHGTTGAKGKSSDSYRKVTVTSVKLMNNDTEEVITEDVAMVFGSEVDCVDHDTDSDRYTTRDKDGDAPYANNKCAQHTLAVNLTPGMYNVAVTGADQTGNEVSKNTDFEVVAKTPFTLELRPGQNFISVPGMPMGETGMLDAIFSDEAITIVRTYDASKALEGMSPWLTSTKDPESGMFSGDITMIEAGKAYFVSSSAAVDVKVKLAAAGALPPTIPVRQGFNAIGYWSSAGYAEDDLPTMDNYLNSIGWTVAYSYDPTPGKGWEVIRKGQVDGDGNSPKVAAGKGYLVYALYDSVLTP